MTFEVRDELGRPWPPGFRSVLCDPEHPLSVVPSPRALAARVAVQRARVRCNETGEGWGTGTVSGTSSPARPVGRMAPPVERGGVAAHLVRPVGGLKGVAKAGKAGKAAQPCGKRGGQ